MRLSQHFYLWEFTRSVTALNHGIDNTPPPSAIRNIRSLVVAVLEPIREELRYPITISSGYRCPELNKLIGGSLTSQHMEGEAADLQCRDNAELFRTIMDKTDFDQLIWEYGTDEEPAWVHVSYKMKDGNRRMVLRATKDGYNTWE
jgi:zinc D-Ala-D-Ala carboxypeptidase